MNTTPQTTKHGIRWEHVAQHDDANQTVYQSSCWRYEIVAYGSGGATLYDAFQDCFQFYPSTEGAVSEVERQYDIFLGASPATTEGGA